MMTLEPEPKLTELYRGIYIKMAVPFQLSTIWDMYVVADDSTIRVIHGDHRPMRHIHEGIPINSRIVVFTQPNVHGECVILESNWKKHVEEV